MFLQDCKVPRKNIHYGVQFQKNCTEKPETLIKMELLLNVCLGILQSFQNCSFLKKQLGEVLLILVNMWIRTITLTAEI